MSAASRKAARRRRWSNEMAAGSCFLAVGRVEVEAGFCFLATRAGLGGGGGGEEGRGGCRVLLPCGVR